MLAGALSVLTLLGALFVARAARVSAARAAAEAPQRIWKWLGLTLLPLVSLPLLLLAPVIGIASPGFSGDLASHARVAAEIARTELPGGWIESYLGGFPFGHHYPPLAWLLLAGAMRLGVPPALAASTLGFASLFALLAAVYLGLVRCGVGPPFAALGAAVVSWIAPYNAFVGGYEAFYSAGLLSQVAAMPICVWFVVATSRADHWWEAPLFAWLAMASHPQIAAATAFVLCLSALAVGQRAAMERSLRSAGFAMLAGAALYGQGIAELGIPFGWPPELGWRQLGFPPRRLGVWFADGELLDAGRLPVITALLAAACLVLLLGLRRPVNRAVLLGLAASVTLSVSGRWWQGLGAVGATLLSFLQPLRVISLVPPLVAVVIALGLEQGAASLKSALQAMGRGRLGKATVVLVALLGFAIAALGLPSRLAYSQAVRSAQQAAPECRTRAGSVAGYDRDVVRSWAERLQGGRLWYEAHQLSGLTQCLYRDGIDVASAVPIGTAAAVGSHVGVLARAAQFLHPERAGSASRAEAIGIGYLLLERSATEPPPGWVVRNRRGDVQLLERPASTVGVGCIEHRWMGTPDRIRARLNAALATPAGADVLLDPHRFTSLEYTSGELVEVRARDPSCDDRNARVHEAVAEQGRIAAEISSTAPVDVVLRVSAFPTWRVRVDAALANTVLVAPGFVAVRIPAGTHRVTAEVEPLPYYGGLIAIATAVTLALAAGRGRLGVVTRYLGRARTRPR